MTTIQFRSHTCTIPERADEMTPKQYLAALRAALIPSDHNARIQVLGQSLLNLPLPPSLYRNTTPADHAALQHAVEQFIDRDGQLHLYPLTNLLPQYHQWRARCGDMLNHMLFSDFLYALSAMRRLRQPHAGDTDEAVTQLVRAMYTHPDPHAKPPAILALHAMTLFSSVWQHITQYPVPLDGEDIPYNILFQQSPHGRYDDDRLGWQGIRLEIARSAVFGPVRQVDRTPLWDILTYLYKCRKEHNRKTRRP